MRRCGRLAAVVVIAGAYFLTPRGADARALPNPEYVGEPPARVLLDLESAEVAQAIRFVVTELKRLSNRFRYATLTACHSASKAAANLNGSNTFLDLELDMLRNQPSRHDVIVFRDEDGSITGLAIDAFPEVRMRELPDPDI
ncbi:hypothetical protein KFE25_007023 [Diacronema lutheri]|uniref:Uncharacterized protein n=1 Tax=Diacronema lutheri TaxID=2081491 RepID=A0A8J5XS43_DIALT|nr:hypothetical protein KFE25_007023 [Diacronema lutheri]